MKDRPKTVLICDDELAILKAAEFKMKRAGYRVLVASDGEEGWEQIQTENPDLVVTDYQMPRLDGMSLIRRIRETQETASLPVILLTAKGFELDEATLRDELQITGLLAKPFSPRQVLSMVEEILGPVGAETGA